MPRRSLLLFSAFVVAAQLLLGGWAWLQLPADANVPIHWGPSGLADGYAPKTVGLLLLPLTTAGVAALFAIIPRIEPRRANLERSGKAYAAIWVAVISLLGIIGVVSVAATLGVDLDVTRIVLVGTGGLFIVIGNYLPKVRPNYMVGIRTPWTLTSDLSWDRTHRVGGRLFVLEGLVFVALGLLRPSPESLAAVILAGVAVMIAFVFAYSYRVWRMDPARRSG